MRSSSGSRMIMFGCAMSIFARSTCAPSGNSPARMRRSRSRFSSTCASRIRAVGARRRDRAAPLADLLLGLRVDVRLARAAPAARRSRTAARSSRSRRARRPTSKPSHRTSAWIASTYFTSSVNGFVSSKRRLHAPAELAREAEVQADRLRVTDVQVAVGLGREARRDRAAEAVRVDVLGDELADEVRAGSVLVRHGGSERSEARGRGRR